MATRHTPVVCGWDWLRGLADDTGGHMDHRSEVGSREPVPCIIGTAVHHAETTRATHCTAFALRNCGAAPFLARAIADVVPQMCVEGLHAAAVHTDPWEERSCVRFRCEVRWRP